MFQGLSALSCLLCQGLASRFKDTDCGFARGLYGVGIRGYLTKTERCLLTRNDKIATPSAPLNDVIISDRNEDDDIEVNPFDGFASGGYNLYEYFTVNEKKKRIEFKQPALEYYGQSDTTEVLVGYIGTGLFDLNTSFVPAKAVNMITLDIAYNLATPESKKD